MSTRISEDSYWATLNLVQGDSECPRGVNRCLGPQLDRALHYNSLCRDCLILSFEAKTNKVEAERDSLRQDLKSWMQTADSECGRAVKAEAERDWLREALEHIRDVDCYDWCRPTDGLKSIARKALEGKDDDTDKPTKGD